MLTSRFAFALVAQTAETIAQPAVVPASSAVAVTITAPSKPAPTVAAPAPVELLPAAARATTDGSFAAVADRPPHAETPDEDDLRERIRLAAQRAIAASSVPEIATTKTAAPKTMPPKTVVVKKTQVPALPPRPRKTVEPKIFVPPRAPDDPGPEPSDGDGIEVGPLRPAKA